MKSSELMIGDWVMQDDNLQQSKVCQITGIYNNAVVDVTGEKIPLHESHIKPILLTPEILEKNGFKPYIPEGHLETVYACQDVSKAVADELYALWPHQDGSFYLLLRVDGKDMVRMDVHYIHQLQHALRLCGITREIIL